MVMMQDVITYLPALISVACLQLVAAMSPGPDFALVLRNSIVSSRRSGLLSALGISLGIIVHVSYVLAGVGAFIIQTPWMYTSIKYLGCGYLIFIGFKGLKTKKVSYEENLSFNKIPVTIITDKDAFLTGFLTNVLNPKCILFFLSIFTLVITPLTPTSIQILSGVEIFLITLIWFSIVAIGFSHGHVRHFFSQSQHWVERITGAVLIFIGLKLILT